MNETVIAYLFLGGTGAGLLVVLSVLELLDACRRPRASRRFFRTAWPLCLLLLVTAAVMLAVDLGRFDRLLQLLVSPEPTAIAIGALSLVLCILGAAAVSIATLSDRRAVSRISLIAVSLSNIGFGIVAMSYTGVLLGSLPSVIAWQTPLIPCLFSLSSLNCGLACALGVDSFMGVRVERMPRGIDFPTADRIVAICETIVLVLWLLWCSSSGASYASHALIAGAYSLWFWVGLVTVGLVLPQLANAFATFEQGTTLSCAASVCVLAGGLILRVCVVGVSAFDPSQAVHALVAPYMQ